MARIFYLGAVSGNAMTFDEVRKIALAWPEVEDGTSYGTAALKVRKKLLARLREDGDSLVMLGVPPGRARHAGGEPAQGVLLHRPLPRSSDGADPAVEGETSDRRTAAAPPMAELASKEAVRGIRRWIVASDECSDIRAFSHEA